jgi:hypothetical protein
MVAPITTQQATDEGQKLAAVRGNQSRKVQAYVEPGVYVEFEVREDFYNYFDIIPAVQPAADQGVSRYRAPRTSTATPRPPSNKGNGVSYKNKARKLAGKTIKFKISGADAPPVRASAPEKKKKTMTIRVPSILSAAAIAVWVNTAFSSTTKRPTEFFLASGTEVGIDPGMNDPTRLKPLRSIRGKTEAAA